MLTEDLIKEAHLKFSTDAKPGYTRQPSGKNFKYFNTDGVQIKDPAVIDRIEALVIPPAWTKVWICPDANGYLQATGRDDRGRKQYRYHANWSLAAQEEKFSHMLEFGKVLPKIRRRVAADMRRRGLPRERVLATIVWLLEKTLIRVGNEEYAKENKSYGLTTLRRRHVRIKGKQIMFEFKGKSGVQHKVGINNQKVAEVIRKCQELPGQELFEYVDVEGQKQTINSEDVNEYLQQISNYNITAKDFRTWAATNMAAKLLDECGTCEDQVIIKKTVTETVVSVSSHLRNRPNTCRKYYIHPFIFKAYAEGIIISNHEGKSRAKYTKSALLNDCEKQVLTMLQSNRA